MALGAAKKYSKSIQETYEWAKDVSLLLMRLIKTLSPTVAAWDTFSSKHQDYFYETSRTESKPTRPDPRRCVNSFRNIDSSFDELRNVLDKLERLNSQYENYRKQVSDVETPNRVPRVVMLKSQKLELFFVVANNRAIVLQQWNVTFVSAETCLHIEKRISIDLY